MTREYLQSFSGLKLLGAGEEREGGFFNKMFWCTAAADLGVTPARRKPARR